jgi:(S)-ureidoglycine aminohydrolase
MDQTVAASRGRRRASYHLLTAPNRYPSRLAGWTGTTVFKLATPRTGPARFGQYLLELESGGGRVGHGDEAFEHFVLVLGGSVMLDGAQLDEGSFVYRPTRAGFAPSCQGSGARLMWIKRVYEPVPEIAPPGGIDGTLDEVQAVRTPTGILRRELLPPGEEGFDFNISLMTFPPGSSLDQVEIHDEEHGLYMTAGAGTYHLDGDDHEVQAGDFIYMAPYCPQFFRPHGAGDAQYLLYKDVFRDGF